MMCGRFLPYYQSPNDLLWHFDKQGEYFVKSGYQFSVQVHDSAVTETSIGGSTYKWSLIWNSKVPPKTRVFAWPMLCDILPTIPNLLLKNVIRHDVCGCCGLQNETIIHALVTCERAQKMWKLHHFMRLCSIVLFVCLGI